jgi:hypothetical protein
MESEVTALSRPWHEVAKDEVQGPSRSMFRRSVSFRSVGGALAWVKWDALPKLSPIYRCRGLHVSDHVSERLQTQRIIIPIFSLQAHTTIGQ